VQNFRREAVLISDRDRPPFILSSVERCPDSATSRSAPMPINAGPTSRLRIGGRIIETKNPRPITRRGLNQLNLDDAILPVFCPTCQMADPIPDRIFFSSGSKMLAVGILRMDNGCARSP
jgi:hypothetical protein